MKIALAATSGGHLTQIQMIFTKEVLGKNKFIILTEKNKKTEKLPNKIYFFKHLGYNPFKYLFALIKCLSVFKKEKINLVITTGAEIGLIAVIASKLLGIKNIYIDTVIRVHTPQKFAQAAYPFSDTFLVQHEHMAKKYGKRAKYAGGII